MSVPNIMLQVAMQSLLRSLGITDDEAVALIDSVKSKQFIVGFARESTPSVTHYQCIIGENGKVHRAIVSRGTDGSLTIQEIKP